MKTPMTRQKRGLAQYTRSLAFALVAGASASALAATPLAVWNGDFNTATTRNGVTFSANDNTFNADGSVTIKEGATTGISFELPSVYDYVTLVFTVSNVTGSATADGVLASTRYNGSAQGGVYVKSGGLSTGGMTGTTAWSTDNVGGTITSYDDNANAVRTFALTQVNSSKLQNGLHLYEVYGGGTAATVVYGSGSGNGLRYGNGYDTLTIGGFKTAPTEQGAIGTLQGLTVLKAAVYVGSTTWPITAGALASYRIPEVLNTDATSASAILAAYGEAATIKFVNFTTLPAALTADASLEHVTLPFDTEISLNNDVLSVAGSLPVKLGDGVKSVTGSGIVVAEGATEIGALPTDALQADTWTGTVWLKNRTGWTDFDLTPYGNSESTLRLTGIQGYPGQNKYEVPCAIELYDGDAGYGLHINNGYGFGGGNNWNNYFWTKTPSLKG